MTLKSDNPDSRTDDDIIFSNEFECENKPEDKKWKIMIVDDEKDIHVITRLALNTFKYKDRGLSFINAYSEKEAIKLMDQNPDVAMILLDVIMEHDDSGFRVIKHIRNKLKNKFVRIVLRTGQPGQSPEKEIIFKYDINDYKEKTELTSRKLYTLLVSSLRVYNDMIELDRLRNNLENIVEERNVELKKIMSQKLEAERESFELKILAQTRLATLGEVATGIAHEINHPLSFINGTLFLLKESIEEDLIEKELSLKMLMDSSRQIDRINNIIGHMRTFSRTEDQISDINFKEIIDNALLLLAERIHLKNIIFNSFIEKKLPTIKGNMTKLEQVFINLIQNSIDAFEDIEKENKKISVNFNFLDKEDTIIIIFSDNASGMKEEVLKNIFEAFYTTKPVGKGTGLGLSIVYKIILEHKGTILCKSTPGEGTEFIIKFKYDSSKNQNVPLKIGQLFEEKEPNQKML